VPLLLALTTTPTAAAAVGRVDAADGTTAKPVAASVPPAGVPPTPGAGTDLNAIQPQLPGRGSAEPAAAGEVVTAPLSDLIE
jgi:hypothetical protein